MAIAAVPEPRPRPDPAELLARAARVAAVARERARETEQARCVSPELIALMREAQLFRIMQPAAYGGFEHGFDVFVEAVAAIAEGDGSTGWVFSLGAVHQWLIGHFPPEAQHEVWGQDTDTIAAGSYAPAGTAVLENGGHRLTGRWSFASGCDNAQWGLLGGMITTPAGRQPGFFLVPRREFLIDDDWNTMGLAGTGSKTIVANDILVPPHRAVTFADLLAGTAPGSAVNRNPLYRLSLLAVIPSCLVAPALGMARGALKAFVDQVGGRSTRGAVAGANNRMAEFATIQLRVAEATASIDAAQLLLHRDLRETADLVARGEAVGLDMRLRNRLTHTFATRLLVQAVDAVFVAAGGSALGLHHPVQRFWRDIHAAGSHISLNWDAVGAMYGQHVFGLEPKGQY
jgi:resorcinol 4-hydroxylase (FADH2)